MAFLEDIALRPVQISSFQSVGLALGEDTRSPLEVVVAKHHTEPSKVTLRTVWKARQANRATPVLLVVLYNGKAALCGPIGDDPPAHVDLDPGQVERICRQALEQPTRHAALKALGDSLPAITSPLSGIRNEGFLATHELEYGAPNRSDWSTSGEKARKILSRRGEDLLKGLGFELEANDNITTILKAADRKIAVAILLQQSESPELRGERFSNLSPVSYALTVADRENLPYVVIEQGSKLRVYPVAMGVGVGRRGRAETYVQCDTALLKDDDAAYLWLLCSADALGDRGSLEELLEESGRFSGELAKRLRERVYESVIPKLATGLVAARNLTKPSAQDLAETYQMAMTLLFRLLFVAYGEDKDLLPFKWNGLYQRRSLKTKAQEILELVGEDSDHDWGDGHEHWEEIARLFRAVDRGNPDWGVPPYNGGLFSDDPEVSESGALLAEIELPDSVMGPVLHDLLIVENPEGIGPVDFRSLGVREFGTVYEGLLESELSVAEANLTTGAEGVYRPCGEADTVVVGEGEVYLHNASGARKATGTYFTKSFAVEHLLDRALEPALDDHFARLNEKDETDAAGEFFDFRVADIAMGSGHFLVAAIDRIERRFTGYLSERHLPGVAGELSELKAAALNALGPLADQVEIEDTQLLRRLIARRCIYGVDINPIAVQLSRLAIWIHTFVAGLPLSFLDHSLVVGNSLVGIGRMSEVDEAIRAESGGLGLWAPGVEDLLADAKEPLRRLANLADANPRDLQSAREAHMKARDALRPAAAFYDIVSATRITGGELPIDAGDWDNLKDRISGSLAHREARQAIGELEPFHFPIAMPEVFLRDRPGFDVILGNPPWESPTLHEVAFWARHFPGLRGLSQTDAQIKIMELKQSRPDLVSAFAHEEAQTAGMRSALTGGAYPGMGTGDPDYYKAFSWRFWDLATPQGWIGVVLPRSALAAKGSTPFRRTVFESAAVADITMILNNRQWFFEDVHPQYTIGLVSIRRGNSTNCNVLLSGPFRSFADYSAGVARKPARFVGTEIASWNDTVSLPLLPTEDSVEVFARLRKAPRLDHNDGVGWRARPYAEAHSKGCKPHMLPPGITDPEAWPVNKGGSFNLNTCETGEVYGWALPTRMSAWLESARRKRTGGSAYAEFPASWANDPSTAPWLHPRVVYRDIARSTDSRTLICTVMPPNVYLADTAPYLLFPRGEVRDQVFVYAILRSLPLDWYARRYVETHVKFYLISTFPVPRVSASNALPDRAVSLAGRSAFIDDRFAEWAEQVGVDCGPLPADEEEDMIHELDAVVAHLYGLEEKHLVHIFETFHEGWDYEDRLTDTLKHFHDWEKKL